jgi:hypothetical protein
MRNEVLAEERDMERAGGHDMEGGGRVATRGESRVADSLSPYRACFRGVETG